MDKLDDRIDDLKKDVKDESRRDRKDREDKIDELEKKRRDLRDAYYNVQRSSEDDFQKSPS